MAATHRAIGLAVVVALGCVPASGVAPRPSEVRPSASAPPAVETLSVAAPPGAPAASAAAPAEEMAILTTPPAPGELECVNRLDPELERESPWSREVGQRVDAALPRLRHCTETLSPGEPAFVTLRLVYAPDGTPTAQHVVHSTANGCAATECLRRALGELKSPKHLIEEASHDVALVLGAGLAPERAATPSDVLALDETGEEADTSCVDPAILQLSRQRVRDVVGTSYTELKKCYNQALTRKHDATGNVTFEFIIGRGGDVEVAHARSATLYDCEAIGCMLTQFRALSFPRPVGRSVRVIYPINYTIEQPPVSLR